MPHHGSSCRFGRNLPWVAALSSLAWLIYATSTSAAGSLDIRTFASGLVRPWSIAFLPDGRSLVTERPGRIRVISPEGTLSPPVAGLPEVFAAQTLGLLDVAVAPDFRASHQIYFCYTRLETRWGSRFSILTLAAATLEGSDSPSPALQNKKILFEQTPIIADTDGVLGGCRIALKDDFVFAALGSGDRLSIMPEMLDNTFGKVIRIKTDGTVPPDNPFVGQAHAEPAIWTLGHRNPEGLAFDPDGQLWEQEHGPQGGDKINLISKGADYGWPVVGYGVNYGGGDIHSKNHRDGVTDPSFIWVPSIAPSGMVFYSGKLWPEWKGSLFNGALHARMVVRLPVPIQRTNTTETLLADLGERIRDVREGPEGALYVLTDNDNGRILRVTPGYE